MHLAHRLGIPGQKVHNDDICIRCWLAFKTAALLKWLLSKKACPNIMPFICHFCGLGNLENVRKKRRKFATKNYLGLYRVNQESEELLQHSLDKLHSTQFPIYFLELSYTPTWKSRPAPLVALVTNKSCGRDDQERSGCRGSWVGHQEIAKHPPPCFLEAWIERVHGSVS